MMLTTITTLIALGLTASLFFGSAAVSGAIETVRTRRARRQAVGDDR